MTPKIVGVVAVSLAAAAVAVVMIVPRNRGGGEALDDERLDKAVVDYGYQTLNRLGQSAVSNCGTELAGNEADVTARLSVEGPLLRISQVRFTKHPWSASALDCVQKTFEGAERRPLQDGVAFKLPAGAEYELDVHLQLETPTLHYNE